MSDETQLVRLARNILQPGGYAIEARSPDAAGADEDEADDTDIVILDLARLDPVAVGAAKRIFAGSKIVALCGEHQPADGVAVIEMGADWLARPFRAEELSARVRAAELHRFLSQGGVHYYRHGDFTVDLLERRATRDGRAIALSPSEFGVLELLVRLRGQVATFGQILAALGRPDTLRDRKALRAFIFGLRRKIEPNPHLPILLLNETRYGYRLAPEGFGAQPQRLAMPQVAALEPK
ncbi:MAG: response regulator transcription factor [Hyphomicrobiales bacterium]|nr:response regulator transcription factor [Hyphomicrobiales bacterium]